jgi:hypothetical protein
VRSSLTGLAMPTYEGRCERSMAASQYSDAEAFFAKLMLVSGRGANSF